MRELRQNPLTGRWVAVAPGRDRRPVDDEGGDRAAGGADEGPARDPGCPFCPGNEAELPAILHELPAPVAPGWRCRAVPNRYPAFSEELPDPESGAAPTASEPLREGADEGVRPGRSRPARGVQEVLIESARHDRRPATMDRPELEALVELYVRRMDRLVRERPGLTPALFRNHGIGAGASLRHPHAQLVATAAIPPDTAVREDRQRRFLGDEGACLLCTLPDAEPDHDARTVTSDDFFRVEVPWAPERPLEAWIVPRRHRASMHALDADEKAALAGTLGLVLRALRRLAGDVDYNFMIHSTAGERAADPALHWLLQLRPVTARLAGFELGTGAVIAASEPVSDATRLRRAVERLQNEGDLA